jgi:hypothetical protein
MMLALFIVQFSYAEDARPNRGRVIDFIQKNLLGRQIAGAEHLTKVAAGKVDSVQSQSVMFNNLKPTKFGLTFDVEKTLKQTLFELDKSGNRSGQGSNKDRTFKRRFVISERLSTGELIGIAFSTDDQGQIKESAEYPFTADAVRVRLEGDKFTILSNSIVYADLYASATKWRPGSAESEEKYSLDKDGRLECFITVKGYDVDPTTLAKTLSDSLPTEALVEVSPAGKR